MRARAQVEVEAERANALRELVRLPAALDDAERPPVGDGARLLLAGLVGAGVRRSPAALSTRNTRPPGRSADRTRSQNSSKRASGTCDSQNEKKQTSNSSSGSHSKTSACTSSASSVLSASVSAFASTATTRVRETHELARPDAGAGGELEHLPGRRERLEPTPRPRRRPPTSRPPGRDRARIGRAGTTSRRTPRPGPRSSASAPRASRSRQHLEDDERHEGAERAAVEDLERASGSPPRHASARRGAPSRT